MVEKPQASVAGRAARWLLPSGLLVGEFVLVSVLYDVHPLFDELGLGGFGRIAPLLLAIATAFVLALWGPWGKNAPAIGPPTRRQKWLSLGAHCLCFALFLWLSKSLFGARALPSGWLAAWAACGLLTVATVVPLALPMRAVGGLCRRHAVPLAVGLAVGLAAWGAGLATELLWRPLGRLTLEVVAALLGLMTGPVVYRPDLLVVGTGTFHVTVAPICSGYQGIGAIVVFMGFFLWLRRKELRFPQALVFLPLGIILVWLANAFRITALIAVGTWSSASVAMGGFHSKAGWLLYCGIALALVAVSRRWSFVLRQRTAPGEYENPTAAYVMPLLAVIATSLATGLFSSGFDRFYGLRVLAALAALAAYRRYYRPLRMAWSWFPVAMGGAVFGLWIALEPAGDPGAADAWKRQLGALGTWSSGAWIALRIFGAVVIAAVVEELAFRGYLLRRLVAADFTEVDPRRFTWLSFVLSSLAFGVMHQRWVAGSLAGLVYAAAVYRRGRLFDAVLAHAVTNALLAIYVLVTERWSLWK